MITLQGITWNHTRGFVPNVATAQRFQELHPDIEIRWQTRSLQAFADFSIADLADKFDLLVIDHPSIGEAASHQLFAPLDLTLPQAFLDDQAANTVGSSHVSYQYDGHQWALACDAATPVSSWRADVLERLGEPVPQTWDDVLRLARAGHVAVPAIPIDSLMNLYVLAQRRRNALRDARCLWLGRRRRARVERTPRARRGLWARVPDAQSHSNL
jgi:multiple sugar transport system substrate-binding protein